MNHGIIQTTKYTNDPRAVEAAEGLATTDWRSAMHPDSTPITTEDTTEETPYGYCHCGCGKKTRISMKNDTGHGHVRGEPLRYINGHSNSAHGRKKEQPVRFSDGDAFISLNDGIETVVSEEDYGHVSRYLWRARRASNGGDVFYVSTSRSVAGKSKSILMHRLILDIPGEIDHRDGDGLNNRRSNLRPATRSQNLANRRVSKRNSSGFKGVSRWRKRWVAQVVVQRQVVYQEVFDTAEEAARAYDEAARGLHGEYARLNFPRNGERQA